MTAYSSTTGLGTVADNTARTHIAFCPRFAFAEQPGSYTDADSSFDASPITLIDSVDFPREPHIWSCSSILSFAKILSGLNAFEISNLQEQETESRYPGDRDITMLHGAEKLLNGVFANHRIPRGRFGRIGRQWNSKLISRMQ